MIIVSVEVKNDGIWVNPYIRSPKPKQFILI